MAKTTTPVAAPPAPPESSFRDFLRLGQISNPNQPIEGLLAEDLFNLLFPVRRYMRVCTEDTGGGDPDTWVERRPDRQNRLFTFDRTPRELNSWVAAAFHSSPYRPPVFFSPCVYGQPTQTAALEDMHAVWAIFDIELDRSDPKKTFPAIDRRSQALARERVAALPVSPWLLIDAASSLTAIWRLSSSAPWDYISLLVDRIARATGARQLPMASGGVRSAVASMLAAKSMNEASLSVARDADCDRRKTALTNVWFPLPGQVAGVLPRHVVSATFLGSMTDSIKVEDLARAYMPPRD